MRLLILTFFVFLWLHPARAEYPEKPITVYVPFASGGAADVLMRDIADKMKIILGQNIIVSSNEDKAVSASEYVRRSSSLKNDGYSLIVGNLGTHGSAPALEGLALRYDPLTDFKPIGMLGETPMYLIIRKDLPIDTFSELLSYLRERKNTVTMGYAGQGSTSYLAGIFFNSLAKITPTMIPYNGSTPAMKDISYGYVDVMIDQSTSALPLIQANLVRAMVYTRNSDGRSEMTKHVPTSAEVGLPEFNITGWNILFAPRDTPDTIINTLNKALREALKDKVILANMHLKNTLVLADEKNTPENLTAFIGNEINRWKELKIPQTSKK